MQLSSQDHRAGAHLEEWWMLGWSFHILGFRRAKDATRHLSSICGTAHPEGAIALCRPAVGLLLCGSSWTGPVQITICGSWRILHL